MTIRTVGTEADWEAVRELCCRTGDAGNPIEASRWPFFAEIWVGPYQKIVPEWTYVAGVAGQVVGYLTGCPSTAALARTRPLAFTLPLLLRVICRRYPWNRDTRRFVRRAFRLDKGPEQRLLSRLPRSLYEDYPAHLHMNVETALRSQGIGQRLVEQYSDDLRRAEVAGVHLFCGPAPRGFYRRLGFEELGGLEFRPGAWVYALARPLGRAPRP